MRKWSLLDPLKKGFKPIDFGCVTTPIPKRLNNMARSFVYKYRRFENGKVVKSYSRGQKMLDSHNNDFTTIAFLAMTVVDSGIVLTPFFI